MLLEQQTELEISWHLHTLRSWCVKLFSSFLNKFGCNELICFLQICIKTKFIYLFCMTYLVFLPSIQTWCWQLQIYSTSWDYLSLQFSIARRHIDVWIPMPTCSSSRALIIFFSFSCLQGNCVNRQSRILFLSDCRKLYSPCMVCYTDYTSL